MRGTEYNKPRLLQGRGLDVSLNKKRRFQALVVSKVLESYPVTQIITSSLIRTKQTAAPFAQCTHTEIESWS